MTGSEEEQTLVERRGCKEAWINSVVIARYHRTSQSREVGAPRITDTSRNPAYEVGIALSKKFYNLIRLSVFLLYMTFGIRLCKLGITGSRILCATFDLSLLLW